MKLIASGDTLVTCPYTRDYAGYEELAGMRTGFSYLQKCKTQTPVQKKAAGSLVPPPFYNALFSP